MEAVLICNEKDDIIATQPHLPRHHLVHEHAKRPPVHAPVIRHFENNLGRNVVGRATECGGLVAILDVLFAHAKIGDLHKLFGQFLQPIFHNTP